MENEKVTLRHPHSNDTVTVDATEAEMVPYMARGYQHVPQKSETVESVQPAVHTEPFAPTAVEPKASAPTTFDPKVFQGE